MRSTFISFLFAALLTTFTRGNTVSVTATGSLFESLRRDDLAAIAIVATRDTVNVPDQTGATPLMYATLYSRPAVVELLLDRGATVNAANTFGSTALMWAAPRTPIVQLLLSRGADVNARASDSTTPIVVAARVGNVEAVQALIAAGADVKSPVTRTNLLSAAYQGGRGSTVREYLESRHITLQSAADLKGPFLARHMADIRVFERLLAVGVDPNQEVPLITLSLPTYFLAAGEGAVDAMRALEKAGVDPKLVGARGWTALMLVAGDDNPSIPAMRHLLDVGVDVNARDHDGRTALDWALIRGETTASEFLRQAGGRASTPPDAPTRAARPYAPKDAVTHAVAKLQLAGPAFSNRTRCNPATIKICPRSPSTRRGSGESPWTTRS